MKPNDNNTEVRTLTLTADDSHRNDLVPLFPVTNVGTTDVGDAKEQHVNNTNIVLDPSNAEYTNKRPQEWIQPSLPKYAYDDLGNLRPVYKRIMATERALIEDEEMRDAMINFRATQREPLDVYNWLLLVMTMADQCHHPDDFPSALEHASEIAPPQFALRQAGRMLLGPYGIVQDWSGRAPTIEMLSSTLDSDSTTSLTDDESRSDSLILGPHRDSGSSESGSRGDLTEYLPVKSELSRETSNCPPVSRLDTLNEPPLLIKRIDLNTKMERQHRQSVLKAQRWVRKHLYKVQKSSKDLAYDRDVNINECKARQNENGSSRFLIEQRLRQYALELREQVAHTWTQHYGDQLEPSSTFHVKKKKSDTRLECWITPVRWIQQRGPK